jgi:UDP-N-acetylmuramate--alanine ligase
MISKILIDAKKKPTILIGGNYSEIDGNVKIGENNFFVTEACEYMDSFLELRPKNAVILNIDSDHLDYFSGINQIVRSFQAFTENVQDDGILFAYNGNVFINDILRTTKKKVITFGHNNSCDFWVENIVFNNKGNPSFSLFAYDKKLGKINLSVPGDHNVINALAAIAVTYTLGIPLETIKKTLKSFKGVARRAEKKGETKEGVYLIDDYAHHPTEIEATIKAIKNIPHEKLWVIFQPHTYTRTLALYKDFAKKLSKADNLILAKIYAAREQNLNNITSEIIYDELPEKYKNGKAIYLDSFEKIATYIKKNAKKGDIVLTLSAGSLPDVCDLILGEFDDKETIETLRAVKIND